MIAAERGATRALAADLTRAIEGGDYLRRSPFSVGGEGFHKEWLHFVVHTPELDVLVNFSLVDDIRPEAAPGAEFPRTVVLVRDATQPDAGWDGDIELFEPEECHVVGGGIAARFGANSVRFADGEYEISIRMRRRPIALDVRLRPLTFPALSNSISLELDDRPINWMVLPRLAASGSARIGNAHHRFVEAPAYHDHNWGHFAWGRDFAWEWGFSLPARPEDPWTIVFVRLADRAHTRLYTQGLFLWRREAHWRIFRGDEMTVAPRGLLRVPRPYKLPAIMNVISAGTDTDVPARLEARAEADGDWAEMTFRAEDVAQVCIPNDTDDRAVTVINEVSGDLQLEGSVRGERVAMRGRAMFEFVRGG
jgi:hypothetical protein